MIEPTEQDIGRTVIYKEFGDHPNRKIEEGVITSFNERFVFVRYGTAELSVATVRESLEFAYQAGENK